MALEALAEALLNIGKGYESRKAEDRAIERQLAAEARADARQIASENRAEERRLGAESREDARQIASDKRALDAKQKLLELQNKMAADQLRESRKIAREMDEEDRAFTYAQMFTNGNVEAAKKVPAKEQVEQLAALDVEREVKKRQSLLEGSLRLLPIEQQIEAIKKSAGAKTALAQWAEIKSDETRLIKQIAEINALPTDENAIATDELNRLFKGMDDNAKKKLLADRGISWKTFIAAGSPTTKAALLGIDYASKAKQNQENAKVTGTILREQIKGLQESKMRLERDLRTEFAGTPEVQNAITPPVSQGPASVGSKYWAAPQSILGGAAPVLPGADFQVPVRSPVTTAPAPAPAQTAANPVQGDSYKPSAEEEAAYTLVMQRRALRSGRGANTTVPISAVLGTPEFNSALEEVRKNPQRARPIFWGGNIVAAPERPSAPAPVDDMLSRAASAWRGASQAQKEALLIRGAMPAPAPAEETYIPTEDEKAFLELLMQWEPMQSAELNRIGPDWWSRMSESQKDLFTRASSVLGRAPQSASDAYVALKKLRENEAANRRAGTIGHNYGSTDDANRYDQQTALPSPSQYWAQVADGRSTLPPQNKVIQGRYQVIPPKLRGFWRTPTRSAR